MQAAQYMVMQQQSEIKISHLRMRHLPSISIYGYVDGRQI